MREPWVRVIADDLTGACDVGAALLPWPQPIVIESMDRSGAALASAGEALSIRNTQSRTCARDTAVARVRTALGDVPAAHPGLVLKKIDTALRGWLGAELDAAMDAVGADTALVVPAIPEVGRTTVGGRQLIDGIPVDETAFARDPQNPVRDACVAAAIEATSRRRARSVSTAEMRERGVPAAVARCRAEGASVVVGDAATDDDIACWVAGIVGDVATRTLVLVGSTGLARGWRATCPSWMDGGGRAGAAPQPGHGVLVIAGSAHPATRAQLEHLAAANVATVVAVDGMDPATAAARLHAGGTVCLVAPEGLVSGGSAAVLGAIAEVTLAVVERVRPAAMVLIGGETAFHVLGRLGHPRLQVEGVPAPLVVRASVLDGLLAGMPLVTKGGSSGPPERLTQIVAEVRR